MTTVLTLVTILLALWALLRFLPAGREGYGPLPYLISLIRFLWIPAVLCLVGGIVCGDTVVIVLAAAIVVLMAVVNSPAYRQRNRSSGKLHGANHEVSAAVSAAGAGVKTVTDTDMDHPDAIPVMTLNCRYGQADAQSIVQAVKERGIEVLALQELTDATVRQLRRAQLQNLLPYQQLGTADATDNGGFNGIWTAQAPQSTSPDGIAGFPAAAVPRATVRGVRFYSVHTKSPMRGCREWSQGVQALASLAASAPAQSDRSQATCRQDSRNRQSHTRAVAATVVMGDLNSSLSHPSFRALLHSGFRDAGLSGHHHIVASFPTWLKWPRLELDHILTTYGIRADHVESVTIPGSDHLALTAHLHMRRD